ncbi:CRISPR-associated helicase Cas3' [Paenibacillus athensensis]|uniref:CRISPR-associated helicase/endonuclease Cas3 n=1 Tax=Paenibacillus athensensis TaxID=1967502 RepID=A0A4Y8PYH6_9BACL|nr:CRISPR-associated helicase Cas3' [Paenibacillus athensensis]MCD1261223.1 CRISPR-associated helicase Cas3' [Paenibacillus athensensis]
MTYIAHIRASDKKIQSVEEHLRGVQKLAEVYGEKIGVKYVAGLAGMLHDMGKYTEAFQTYIIEAVNNPDAPPRRGSVDHSTAGARLLFQMLHTWPPEPMKWVLAELVGNAILSHHSYLHDFLSPNLESPYLRRVKEVELKEFERSKACFFQYMLDEEELRKYVAKALAELEAYLNRFGSAGAESQLMFLSKFVFSALIDADRTNTRLFEENKSEEVVPCRGELFDSYYQRLLDRLDSFEIETDIDVLRRQMSEQCEQFAKKPSGIYTLSIPTGGGKTLASLRYALKHACKYQKKHIIYVVPYTTIIEQNAEEVRRILKDDQHILEHHSNVVDDVDDDDENEDGFVQVRQKLKLAKDNWDSPIIFTTLVQFLNVFYAKGSRNIRRLHHLCESVIIFDEVQKVPASCVSLFNLALNFLNKVGKSSLILCTATQPALDSVKYQLEIDEHAEIIPDLDRVEKAFKRVEIVDRVQGKPFDTNQLAELIHEQMTELQSVLVILNTKAVVKRLYRQLAESDFPVYHLSTAMCAAHRKHILQQVKTHLERKEKVLCISTQLIEAGVDISFECVIRSLAGLDSLAQAAGRCNRHGKDKSRNVYLIDHEEEKLSRLKEISRGKQCAGKLLRDLQRDPSLHQGNILSGQAMKRYFMEFYGELTSSLEYFIPGLELNMTELLTANRNNSSYNLAYKDNKRKALPLCLVNSYRTAAENFDVIDQQGKSVIVPFGDKGKDIIVALNGEECIELVSRLLRQAQQYTIQLFDHEWRELGRNGGLVSLAEGKIWALKESAYSDEYGLAVENDGSMEMNMI